MKSPGAWVNGVLLPVLLLVGCIDFNAEKSFCEHATTAQQQAICGSDAGSPGVPDAGVDASCGTSSSCDVPPSQCHESRGTCVSGKCEYPLKQTGAACNDATPASACHGTSGTCEAGVCRSALRPAGASCEDGQLCTVNDTCDSAGRCVGGSPFVCDAPPTQCHEAAGTCVNNTCTYKLKTAGAACNDGDKCTESDKCNSAGICVGTAKSCTAPPNSCYQPTGTCDASSGACSYGTQPAGFACESGNLCTEDICDGVGRCVPDTVATCEDRSQSCEVGTCNSTTGCQYTSKCSGNQICQAGRCCVPRFASMLGTVSAEQCFDTPEP